MAWPIVVSIHGYHRVLPPDQAAGGKGTVPPGGLAGQVLAKASGADYDLVWADLPGPGPGPGGLVGDLAWDFFWGGS